MTEETTNVQEQNVETTPDPTEEEKERTKRIHKNTLTASDLALSRGAISEESHAAVYAGTMTLQEAKDLGPENGPDGPVAKPKAKKAEKQVRECACGCGEPTGGTWKMGHDARLPGLVLRSLRGEVELTDEQREHAERRDLFARAEEKLAKGQEKAAKKAKADK